MLQAPIHTPVGDLIPLFLHPPDRQRPLLLLLAHGAQVRLDALLDLAQLLVVTAVRRLRIEGGQPGVLLLLVGSEEFGEETASLVMLVVGVVHRFLRCCCLAQDVRSSVGNLKLLQYFLLRLVYQIHIHSVLLVYIGDIEASLLLPSLAFLSFDLLLLLFLHDLLSLPTHDLLPVHLLPILPHFLLLEPPKSLRRLLSLSLFIVIVHNHECIALVKQNLDLPNATLHVLEYVLLYHFPFLGDQFV